MISDPVGMLRQGLVVVALLGSVIGCTSPNPRSCADGTCTDPAFPFCDVDGTFGDTIDTCVAVMCVEGEVAACRGDFALRCNATGNDFDLVECGFGCDAATGGCKECQADAQCSDTSPICDTATNACRSCLVDDECPSRVCNVDTGACLAEVEVVYAASNGGDAAACTLDSPCSLTRAVSVASDNASRSTVRLLPGLYGAPLTISEATVSLVGPGATHQATSGTRSIELGVRANVTIRGLALDTDRGLSCEGSPIGAMLSLRDLTIDAAENLTIGKCSLVMRNVSVSLDGQSIVTLGTGSVFDSERVRFTSPGAPRSVSASGVQMAIRVVNTLFDNVSFSFGPQDTNTMSNLAFAFNTVFINGTFSPVVSCTASGTGVTAIENNIVLKLGNQGVQDAINGSNCVATHNVLFPQNAAIAGDNNVADPMLVDPTNHDFHPKPGSPAIDTAVPSLGIDPILDLEGVARPQGAAADIGAFERVP